MTKLGSLVLAIVATTAPGCVVSMGQFSNLKATKTVTQKLVVDGLTELQVDTHNGSVALTPSDDNQIWVEAVLRARTDEDLEKINVESKNEGTVAKVGWSGTDGSQNHREVSFRIKAPKTVLLKVKTSAGQIDVEKFENGLDANTSAGSIQVLDVVGNLKLNTSAGSIHVKGAKGTVNAVSHAGEVSIRGILKGDNVAKSSAGSVDVYLNTDSPLKVKASTGAGSASNDFGWTVSGQVNRSTGGLIGDGSAGTLEVHSGAGSVSVRKGN